MSLLKSLVGQSIDLLGSSLHKRIGRTICLVEIGSESVEHRYVRACLPFGHPCPEVLSPHSGGLGQVGHRIGGSTGQVHLQILILRVELLTNLKHLVLQIRIGHRTHVISSGFANVHLRQWRRSLPPAKKFLQEERRDARRVDRLPCPARFFQHFRLLLIDVSQAFAFRCGGIQEHGRLLERIFGLIGNDSVLGHLTRGPRTHKEFSFDWIDIGEAFPVRRLARKVFHHVVLTDVLIESFGIRVWESGRVACPQHLNSRLPEVG